MDFQTLTREMTPDQILFEVNRGARFVVYQYVISALIVTFRRNSSIQYVAAGQSAAAKSLPWTALTFFLGWWGFPWGLIRTPQALFKNLQGGIDVTAHIVARMKNPTTQTRPAPSIPSLV